MSQQSSFDQGPGTAFSICRTPSVILPLATRTSAPPSSDSVADCSPPYSAPVLLSQNRNHSAMWFALFADRVVGGHDDPERGVGVFRLHPVARRLQSRLRLWQPHADNVRNFFGFRFRRFRFSFGSHGLLLGRPTCLSTGFSRFL